MIQRIGALLFVPAVFADRYPSDVELYVQPQEVLAAMKTANTIYLDWRALALKQDRPRKVV